MRDRNTAPWVSRGIINPEKDDIGNQQVVADPGNSDFVNRMRIEVSGNVEPLVLLHLGEDALQTKLIAGNDHFTFCDHPSIATGEV